MERKSFCVAMVLLGWLSAGVVQADQSPTYAWRGELVGTDTASSTLTLRVKTPDHIGKYIDRFKAGDRIVLVWNMLDKHESDSLIMIDSTNPSNSKRLDHGYILPAEFVSADKNTVTVKLHVDGKILQAARSLGDGTPIRATASVDEPTDTAALVTIAAADRSQPSPQ